MPPKRRVERLAVILDCPIGHVAVVKGEGQYDAANKRFRYNAILYDQEGNRVFLPGRARNVLTINVPKSDTKDPAAEMMIVKEFAERAFSVETTDPSPATQGASSADPELQRTAVREDRFTQSW